MTTTDRIVAICDNLHKTHPSNAYALLKAWAFNDDLPDRNKRMVDQMERLLDSPAPSEVRYAARRVCVLLNGVINES